MSAKNSVKLNNVSSRLSRPLPKVLQVDPWLSVRRQFVHILPSDIFPIIPMCVLSAEHFMVSYDVPLLPQILFTSKLQENILLSLNWRFSHLTSPVCSPMHSLLPKNSVISNKVSRRLLSLLPCGLRGDPLLSIKGQLKLFKIAYVLFFLTHWYLNCYQLH